MLRVTLISFLIELASLSSETFVLLRNALTRGRTSCPATSETTSSTTFTVTLMRVSFTPKRIYKPFVTKETTKGTSGQGRFRVGKKHVFFNKCYVFFTRFSKDIPRNCAFSLVVTNETAVWSKSSGLKKIQGVLLNRKAINARAPARSAYALSSSTSRFSRYCELLLVALHSMARLI